MMIHQRPLRRTRRRGATTVEFALTAPILFVLVLGAIEFSRANMLLHTTSIAATEAARRSIIPGATANEVRLKAIDELAVIGVVDASVVLNPPEIRDDTSQVTVNLTVPITLRNGYGLTRMFLGKQLFKSVTLQREGMVEEVATETIQRGGMQTAPSDAVPASSGAGSTANGNGNGNNGNGLGNGGGNGSNGNGGGGGNSGGGNSGSGSGGLGGMIRGLLGL